jgi:AraC-like DNA-binding protein
MNLMTYQPRQPFFEGSGEAYVFHEETLRTNKIQFYSFLVSGDPLKDWVAVPDGTIDLVFHCSGHHAEAFVCGSVKKGTPLSFVPGDLYFGVRFYPSAAETILGCPLDEFTDREVPLADVIPEAQNVMEQICGSGQFASQIGLFRQFHQRVTGGTSSVPGIVSYLLNEIHQNQGELRIHELEEKSGYSARHIDNIFKKYVGMGPKFYSRVVRFQKTVRRLRNHLGEDLSQVAEEAGYYDQAHFINEFRTFCTMTPRQLVLAV